MLFRDKSIVLAICLVFLLVSFPQTAFAGSCKITDSDLRNWEFSSGFAFSGAKGNTDKTDIGVRICYEFEDAENRLTSKSKYEFGKVDGVTNEDLWDSNLSYLRRIKSTSSETKSVFFDFSSFAERDEINLIDLRFGLGAGLLADFPLSPSSKASASVLVFWEREDRKSLPVKDFASLRFGAHVEKKTKNTETSLSSVLILPPSGADDFRSETSAELGVPFSETITLRLTADLNYENEPANTSLKKTDFRYATSLNFEL